MITNVVYQGDCIQGLKLLPDKSVDLILTDPPYGVNLGYDVYEDTEDNWFKLMKEFIPEAQRVAKMVIMPSCQIKRLKWIYDNFPPDWLICWYKGSTGTAGFLGFNDWEPLLVYGKVKHGMHDYFKATPEPFDNGHPCPKPKQWARWIIKRATDEGMIVCDPFAGSGSTLSACKELNRKWVGFEISPEYCKIIQKRLSQKVMMGFFDTQAHSTNGSFNKDLTGNSDEFPQILPLAELR